MLMFGQSKLVQCSSSIVEEFSYNEKNETLECRECKVAVELDKHNGSQCSLLAARNQHKISCKYYRASWRTSKESQQNQQFTVTQFLLNELIAVVSQRKSKPHPILTDGVAKAFCINDHTRRLSVQLEQYAAVRLKFNEVDIDRNAYLNPENQMMHDINKRWNTFHRDEWQKSKQLGAMLSLAGLYYVSKTESTRKKAMLKCVHCRRQFPEDNVIRIRHDANDYENCVRVSISIINLHSRYSNLCTLIRSSCNYLTTTKPLSEQLSDAVTSFGTASVDICDYENNTASQAHKYYDQLSNTNELSNPVYDEISSFLAESEYETKALFNVSEAQWLEQTNSDKTASSSSVNFIRQLLQSSPAHENFLCESERLATFSRSDDWNTQDRPSGVEMARAGFLLQRSAGEGDDTAVCHWCNAEGSNWNSRNDVWIRHIRMQRNKPCAFVLSRMSGHLIESALDLSGECAQDYTCIPHFSSDAGFVPPVLHRYDMREIRSYVENIVIRNLYESLGYPRQLVSFCVELQYEETGHYPTNAGKVLERLHEPATSKQQSSMSSLATGQASSQHQQENGVDKPPCHLSCLSDEQICKVCLERPKECVFLPCAHRVCCVSCSARVKTCPVCRLLIQKTVNYYDS